jgi:hypothetical protein
MEPLTLESEILANRWRVDQRAVLKWMKARGFKTVMGLMAFGGDHAESMGRALADFWEFST